MACLCGVLYLWSSSIQAQQKPQYDTAKGFYEYQKKMNAYFNAQEKEEHDDDEEGEEAEGEYEQWKRLEWYYSTRLGKDGKLVNLQQMKQVALQKASRLKNNIISQPQQVSGGWALVGPTSITGNEGIGRVNRLGFLNSDANTIYAATAGGGLWKTTTGGTSWQPLTDGLPNSNLSGVAVNQSNPNILYILTGDGDGGGPGNGISTGKYSTGVLKSTDGGNAWNYTGLKWNETDNYLGYKLIMHPSDFNVLLVGTSNGIFRTANGGSTWISVLNFENAYIYDIEFMPNNGQVVYAGAYGGKFYKSTDGGITWALKHTVPGIYANRVSISVTPANSSNVYFLVANNSGQTYTFNGIYYSNNMGETGSWVQGASTLPNVFSGDGTALIGRQESYDHSMAVSPINQNKLITGGISIFVSTNGGNSVSYIDNDLANYHVDIHDLVYGPSGNVLYAATDGGIYKSTNDGLNWISLINNLAITQYYRISVSNANSSHILGGAQDNGSHLRTTNTSVFEQTGGKDGADNAISASNSNIMYEGSTRGPFRYSNDNGQSFGSEFVTPTILSANYSITADAFWITNIQVSPINHHIIFLGYMPVVKGSFNGSSWTFSAIGIKPLDTVSGKTVLNVAPSNASVIYAGDNNYNGLQKLWRTINGGTSWQILVVPYSVQPFTRLTINPVDPNEIWLTYGGFSAGSKVFHSENGGTIWNPYTGSLPNVPINCIVYDDNNGRPDDALYIGTDIGVFYRDNTLGDWIPFSNGLPVVEVTDLEISKSSGLLRAGTYGRGIWQTSLYTSNCLVNENFTTNSHPPSEPAFVSVTNTITSTAIIKGVGANIQYKAGNGVILNPGFRIDGSIGAKFIAYTGPCPGGGVPPGYTTATMNGTSGYLIENK